MDTLYIREEKGSPLTHFEMDSNWRTLTTTEQELAAALDAEISSRETIVNQEIQDRINSIQTETDARIAAIANEVSARNTAIDTKISQQTTLNNNIIMAGVTAKDNVVLAAVTTEVGNRITAINLEVTNRNEAINSAVATEFSNRNVAITNAINEEVAARNTAIEIGLNSILDGVPDDCNTLSKIRTIITSGQINSNSDINSISQALAFEITNRVDNDAITLSTAESYTDFERDRAISVESTLVPKTTTVNGHSLDSNVTITASDVGLSNVSNLSPGNMPVSVAQATADAVVLSASAADATSKSNAAQAAAIAASTPISHVGTGDNAHALATVTADGFMSATNLVKLNAVSGSNTGDETDATIISKLGFTPVSNTTTINGHSLADNVTVTATDVGLDNVNNTSDVNKPVSTAQATADAIVLTSAKSYTDAETERSINAESLLVPKTTTVNGHDLSANITLTASDVGLGNLDNTSDINKSVSTAQATAIATALSTAKTYTDAETTRATTVEGTLVPKTITVNGHTLDSNVTVTAADVGLGNLNNTSDINKPVSTAQAAADADTLASAKTYADGLIVGLWDDRGNYDASGNTFPTTGGSGLAGAVLKGDIWTISVAGTLDGVPVVTREFIRATIDSPGQTLANWAIGLANTDIDNTITSGVTGRAPSQDAVFNAIASEVAARNTAISTGNSATATKLATGRTVSLTGDVIYTSPAFDGSGNVTAAATLANSGVTANSYGGSTLIPVITVDAKGRITNVSTTALTPVWANITGKPTKFSDTGMTLAVSDVPTLNQDTTGKAATVTTNANLSGDITSVGNVTTLPNINSNVGTFGDAAHIPIVTVNAKGQVLSVSTQAVTIVSTLSGLSDVAESGLAAGNVLTYNSTTGKWNNNTLVAAGIQPTLGAGSVSNTMLANGAVANLTGSNTGDETATTIKTKLGITTLTGSNTGDETNATIISKLGFTPVAPTLTINGRALNSNISITASDVGLGNVNNTSDANKPVSTAQATANAVVLSSAASDATTKANAAQAAAISTSSGNIATAVLGMVKSFNSTLPDVSGNINIPLTNVSTSLFTNVTNNVDLFPVRGSWSTDHWITGMPGELMLQAQGTGPSGSPSFTKFKYSGSMSLGLKIQTSGGTTIHDYGVINPDQEITLTSVLPAWSSNFKFYFTDASFNSFSITKIYLGSGTTGSLNVDYNYLVNKPVLSGSNTGDETLATILSKLGFTPLNKAGDTIDGTLTLSATAIIQKLTGGGIARWMQTDGTGRQHWYWNTNGGATPIFDYAEDASDLATGSSIDAYPITGITRNGGYLAHRSAVAGVAGGPVTWVNTIYVDQSNFVYKGANVFTSANLTKVSQLTNDVGYLTTLGAGYVTNAMLANAAVANLSGTNTGDETTATIKSKLSITTLSGSNTGDETQTTINTKIGYVPVAPTVTVNGHALSSNITVTATDVGLGNVTNTSDANKPVSTAQAAADAVVLSSAKTYADGLVVGLWDDRGNYNASVNTFPTTGGSGTGGAILKGDIWTVSVAGTLGGVPVAIRQFIRAMVDSPAQVAANWAIGLANTDVDNSITVGVTGRAPSQDAVATGLANAALDATNKANDAQFAAIYASAPSSHVGAGGVEHAVATTVANGFMSSANVVKLNAISGTNTGDQTTITGNAGTATKLATGRSLSITGDITWTSPAFDGSGNVTAASTLTASGVIAGTYSKVTVDSKGRVTYGETLTAADLPLANTLSLGIAIPDNLTLTSTTAGKFSVSTAANMQINSLGVGTVASQVAGEIRAVGDITAFYSDGRLKKVLGHIPNAVARVMELNGVYYTGNDVAGQYGFDTTKVQVGLLTEDLNRVLPEVIADAPFDIGMDNEGNEYSLSGQQYKTAHYDRVIPLLVEAIKEQHNDNLVMKEIMHNQQIIIDALKRKLGID